MAAGGQLRDVEVVAVTRSSNVGFEDAYRTAGLGSPQNGGLLPTFTAADLMATTFPSLWWAIPGVLPEGVILLAGKPKLGKSWLVLALCLAIALGGVALGTVRVEQGTCLYLALEDNRRRLQRRLEKLLIGGEPPADLHMATEWPRLDEGGAEALEGWLEAHPEARLVVIDTLAKARPRSRGQNVYAEDYAALEELLPLASKYQVAIVVVHHLRKGGAADPLDEISGSTGLSGGVDGMLILKRERGRADASLYVDGRDIEEQKDLALRWDPALTNWVIAGDADEFRLGEERAAIVGLLREADGPMGPKKIAEALGMKDGAVRELLSRMAKDGDVDKVGRGQYTVRKADIADIPDNRIADVSDVSDVSGDETEEGELL